MKVGRNRFDVQVDADITVRMRSGGILNGRVKSADADKLILIRAGYERETHIVATDAIESVTLR